MKIDILTLFPDSFAPLKESIIGRAVNSGKLDINVINIRDFSTDKHKKCDDEIFGGGDGMLMMPQPLADCLDSVVTDKSCVYYMSPKGKTFSQSMAKNMAKIEHLVLICGHYEGIDQRIIDIYVDEEISIGDFVLTGGELPAMVVVDAVARLLPDVLGNEHSALEESFENGLLEYPQYTRPSEFRGHKVPDVLLSGNHALIAKWRKEQSEEITRKRRPDLIKED
ncbi:MAG: tRNA (guanosine(37)-N1)-methyltransferase TrmD [Clostridia bacterium]|nr:tRNA (guanosine(37)-N1)-methyltransferase TrmD [Clostridia bacterium]